MRDRRATETRAFTLIELLVVIAVIGLLAGLLIPLSGVASAKMRLARVNAELNNLITAIENYKLEVGEYPPDNGNLKTFNLQTQSNDWRKAAWMNPLYYELSGAVFTNNAGGEFRVRSENTADPEKINAGDLNTYFARTGIRNSARIRADIPYKGIAFRESQHVELKLAGKDIEVLAVAAPGPQMQDGQYEGNPNATKKFNPWYYDSSTTNRHNRQSFDLWAEILIGKETHVIGNWKN